MKLPTFRRIFKGDYPEEFRVLVEKLSQSINSGIEVLYEALNNKLTLAENLRCTVTTIQVSVNASGTPAGNVTVRLNTTDAVTGVQVMQAINLTNPRTYPTSAPFISFRQSGNVLTIVNVAGLTVNDQWSLSIVAYTG